jgi:hypothetical protein
VLRRQDDSAGNSADTSSTSVSERTPTATIGLTPTTVAQVPVPVVTDPPTTIATPAVAPTTSYPVTAQGHLADLSFVDALHGWALVQDSSTPTLLATSDGGRSWSHVDVEVGGALNVVFADPANGWLFGGYTTPLQSTHDGGTTWQTIDLTAASMVGGPVALTTDGETVTIVAGIAAPDQNVNWTVASSPVGGDDFVRLGIDFQQGAGPANDFSLAASGGDVWIVYNDRIVTGLGRIIDERAVPWSVPWSDLGGAAYVTIAGDGGLLWVTVAAGTWTDGVVDHRLYVSDDNGESFRQITLPVDQTPMGTLLFPVDASTMVVDIIGSDGLSNLYRSNDDGATWQFMSTFNGQLVYSDGTTTYATLGTDDKQTIGMSTDNGVSWQPILVVG